MEQKTHSFIESFSKHLFWDVDKAEISPEKHSRYIIEQVLQYGKFEDWDVLSKYYGITQIAQYALSLRGLDKRTVSFLSVISNIPKSKFICYSLKQSTAQHWNF